MNLLLRAKVNRFRFTFACKSKPISVYAHRVVGGYRHHCNFGSDFAAGTELRPGKRTGRRVPEQPQTIRKHVVELC